MMSAVDAADQIIRTVEARRGALPYVVALDGFSGAGKSTIARAVANRLDAATVHGDDFYRDLSRTDRLALCPEDGVDRYFDWPRLRREALEPLRHGTEARFRAFDWDAGHGLAAERRIPARAVIVLDGVYSARPTLSGLVDLTVYVDAPEPVRRERRRARQDPPEWEAGWDAAEHVYFSRIRPPHSFDLVVSGGTP